jgi:hypothetical protein
MRVDRHRAASRGGGAPLAQRAVRAYRAEGDGPGGAHGPSVPSRAGDRALLFIDGEVIGLPRNETLANLSALPDHVIAALGKMLKGAALAGAGEAFEVERSVPHGNAAAAHVMASKLGLAGLLGPACRERDIACALILSRSVRPESKLPAVAWWASGDTTLGADLSVADASADEVHVLFVRFLVSGVLHVDELELVAHR